MELMKPHFAIRKCLSCKAAIYTKTYYVMGHVLPWYTSHVSTDNFLYPAIEISIS